MKRKILAVILSQSIIASFVGAAMIVNASVQSETATEIKRVILMDAQSNPSCDYNQNSTVDVFDMIRYKSDMIKGTVHFVPSTPLRSLINDLYKNILLTSPDIEEASEIENQLISGSTNVADVVKSLMERTEYTSRNTSDAEYVTMMYTAILGRDPDETGFGNWCKRIQYFSRTRVLSGFICSNEFSDRCSSIGIQNGNIPATENRDVNSTLTATVFDMYNTVCSKKLSPDELNTITGNIMNRNIPIQFAAFNVADCDEFNGMDTGNYDYITALYKGILERDPSGDELSSANSSLESGLSRASLLRKVVLSNDYNNLCSVKGLGGYLQKFTQNTLIGGTWYHISPNGDMFTVQEGTVLKGLLDQTNQILNDRGRSISDIYNYVRATTRYKYIEQTKSLEQIESIGWVNFANYAMNNYYGVCYHLAAKADFLFEQAGYECRIIHSTHGSGDHYWNQVLVDGGWVNYDLTNNWYAYDWDRIIQAGNYTFLGYVRPDYR